MTQRKRKKVGLKIFLTSALITFTLCGLAMLTGIITYDQLADKKEPTNHQEVESETIEDAIVSSDEIEKVEEQKENIKESQTVAIFGTDQAGSLTDVIFVAHFKSDTNEVNILSIPRDTKVEWTQEQIDLLPKAHQWVKVSKINEMTSWGSIEEIRQLTVSTLESLLGIKIDHYVVVNLDAFRQIVDAIGGVEIDIKQRMKKDDYSQGLHIDLNPGLQRLDGEKAEQFVRFRSYPTGDLGRIQAQQQFLEAFAKQLLSTETLTKLPKLVPILFKSIKTDIGLMELPNYYPYIQDFSIENLSFDMLPGEAGIENRLSYFFPDLDAVSNLVQERFF